MTDATTPRGSILVEDDRTRRRNAAEKRFRYYGLGAIGIGLTALLLLIGSILYQGIPAFFQTTVSLDVPLPAETLDPEGNRDPAEIARVITFSYAGLIDQAVQNKIDELGIDIEGLQDPGAIISRQASATVRDYVLQNPDAIGGSETFDVLTSSRIDQFFKGVVTFETAERDSQISPAQLQLAQALEEAGDMQLSFNWNFITAPDASDQRPEAAGLGVAILGSLFMMLVVLVLALPIGVAASIYLEEFAPKNRLTDIIEVNISNLAAVPSIVYGILGLAIFINFAGLPQSAPIVGGLVLTLMTLPTIIISTRASLKSVPPSIRDAALGVGASKMQSVFHHVLPLAGPGILTGTIIGLAQALGETAPLLLIGMVAFVSEYPDGFFDPASALPVQVYNWTQRADPAFAERASGAIIVLLLFLAVMNITAIVLRRRFERRW